MQQSGTSESGIVDNIVLYRSQEPDLLDLEVGSTEAALRCWTVMSKVKNDLTIAADRVLDLATYDIVVTVQSLTGCHPPKPPRRPTAIPRKVLNIKDAAGTTTNDRRRHHADNGRHG